MKRISVKSGDPELDKEFEDLLFYLGDAPLYAVRQRAERVVSLLDGYEELLEKVEQTNPKSVSEVKDRLHKALVVYKKASGDAGNMAKDMAQYEKMIQKRMTDYVKKYK